RVAAAGAEADRHQGHHLRFREIRLERNPQAPAGALGKGSQRRAAMNRHRRALLCWLAVGAAGYLIFPWYAFPHPVLGLEWLRNWAGKESAPALVQIVRHDRGWLAPLGLLLVAGGAFLHPSLGRGARANGLVLVGA